MKAIGIEDLRPFLPWGQDSASDDELNMLRESINDIDRLADAVRKMESASFLRFERQYVSVETDRFYPILHIYFDGIDPDQVGMLLQLNK